MAPYVLKLNLLPQSFSANPFCILYRPRNACLNSESLEIGSIHIVLCEARALNDIGMLVIAGDSSNSSGLSFWTFTFAKEICEPSAKIKHLLGALTSAQPNSGTQTGLLSNVGKISVGMER